MDFLWFDHADIMQVLPKDEQIAHFFPKSNGGLY